MYEVCIIGGGICGCAAAFELSRLDIPTLLIEKENDIALGATRANSAIIHAGYDPEPGTIMAMANVAGNRYTRELAAALDVPFKPIGSLVAAFDEADEQTIHLLYERGRLNGVPGLRILTGDEAHEREPGLSHNVTLALYAPTAGIISPWELALALCETAVTAGVELKRSCGESVVRRENGVFVISTAQGEFQARRVINAAGIDSGKVSTMLGEELTINPSRGEYFVLDKNQGDIVNHVIFQCPGAAGKGVLVTPTVHGNLLAGPSALPSDSTQTSAGGLEYVKKSALRSVPGIDFSQTIRTYAGLRAQSNRQDFIVGRIPGVPGSYNLAGIKSPGLSSATALAAELTELMISDGLPNTKNPRFTGKRKAIRFRELSAEQLTELTERDSAYGEIVCRCEHVTEGEVRDALNSVIPPVSIDGVKRRVNAGMGRCQGGFCGMRVAKLLAKAQGVTLDKIGQDLLGSYNLLPE